MRDDAKVLRTLALFTQWQAMGREYRHRLREARLIAMILDDGPPMAHIMWRDPDAGTAVPE